MPHRPRLPVGSVPSPRLDRADGACLSHAFSRCRATFTASVAVIATLAQAAAEEPVQLDDYVVSVARAPQERDTLPLTVRVVRGDLLARSLTLDGALREDPAFSLFRRSSSLSANPTAQGVSLRGVGPSGASRTAVFLDDVPLNDPFGGWVAWSQIPSLALAGAEIAHGGGSGVWGNAALGGTVAIASAPLADPAGVASFQAGSHGLWRAEIAQAVRVGGDTLRLNARLEDYDGFFAFPASRRGAVDRRLSHAHRLLGLSWRHGLSSDVDATISARYFDEDRGNGTVLQRNDTNILHGAATLEGRDGADPIWRFVAWGQRQEYSSFFSAVATDRGTEAPANDQFAVPSRAAGLQAIRLWQHAAAATVLGVDGRWVDGETRENYLYRDGAFAQRRIAGGTQQGAGAFLHHDRALGSLWHLTAAARVDTWANLRGHTREFAIASGAVSRDERHPDRSGATLSPRLGVSARWTPDTTVRAAVYRGFRQPTLNEYYRPFRVGSTNTLANPALTLESLHGIDIAIDHRIGDLQLGGGVFWSIMDDAVGNVTLSSTPSGITRQRQNIGELRIRGVEFSATWTPTRSIRAQLAGLISDAEVAEAPAQPNLVGRQLAQVPEYVLTFSAEWRARPDTRLSTHLRAVGRQFEDDENQLVLDAACTIALRVEQRVSAAATLFLELQNALDHPAQTSRLPTGFVTYDEPRSFRGGLNVTW